MIKSTFTLTVVLLLGSAVAQASCPRPSSQGDGEPPEPTVTIASASSTLIRIGELRDIVDNLDGDRRYNPCTRDGYIAELDALLVQHPTMPEALVLRARMGLMNADNPNPDFSAAKVWIDRSLSHNPKDAESYVLLGHILNNLGEPQAAYAALDKAEALGSSSPWIRLNRANIDRLHGNMRQAMERYQEVAHDETVRTRERTFAFSMLAQDAVSRKEWDEAQRLIEAQSDLEPNNISSAWAHGNFASQLLFARRYQQAVDSARRALSFREYGNGHRVLTAGLYLLAVEDHLHHGRLSSAGLRAFEEARSREPVYSEAMAMIEVYRDDSDARNGLNGLFYAPESVTGVPSATPATP